MFKEILYKNQSEILSVLKLFAKKFYLAWCNEKLLREQLCYYDDIDYSEEVEYISIPLS